MRIWNSVYAILCYGLSTGVFFRFFFTSPMYNSSEIHTIVVVPTKNMVLKIANSGWTLC